RGSDRRRGRAAGRARARVRSGLHGVRVRQHRSPRPGRYGRRRAPGGDEARARTRMTSTNETVVRMPKLADTLVEGTLGRWLKQVGESVSQGEALASIETDKVTAELTSPAAGTLLEIMVDEGTTVAVETAIARIGDASAAIP